jgi:hypothetical protein
MLTTKEIRYLTNRVQAKAQSAALKTMGIDFITRPDGSPVVLESSLNPCTVNKEHQPIQENFDSL